MIYSIRHLTEVEYDAPIARAEFNLRLAPWHWPGQAISRHVLRINPEPSLRIEQSGPYCVNTTRIGYETPVEQIEVCNEFEIDVRLGPAPETGPLLAEVAAQALAVQDVSILAPAPYLFASRIAQNDAAIDDWAGQYLDPGADIITVTSSLMSALHFQFTYKTGVTDTATPPHAAFKAREGVCQDFAHIMIIALRSHGIPAAYASGYLRTDPPPGKPRLVGADAMHAWVNVWCGHDLGWVGFDPTNDCLARTDHVQIAMGRDYADVAPIDGTFIGNAQQNMTTSVDVEPIG
jgi:transglutaminase-like putative cysteine protease